MKIIISLLMMLVFSQANAFVATAHSSKTPDPPAVSGCAYQVRVEPDVYKCYTQEQWDYKNKIEEDYRNSKEGKDNNRHGYIVVFLFLFSYISIIMGGIYESWTVFFFIEAILSILGFYFW